MRHWPYGATYFISLSPVLGEGAGVRGLGLFAKPQCFRKGSYPPSPQPSPPEYRGRGGHTTVSEILVSEILVRQSYPTISASPSR